MHLETRRLIIRDFRAEDASDLQEILGDGEVMAHCEPPYTPRADGSVPAQLLHGAARGGGR